MANAIVGPPPISRPCVSNQPVSAVGWVATAAVGVGLWVGLLAVLGVF